MSGPAKESEALVLDRKHSGESMLHLSLYCRSFGLVSAMQRLPRSARTGTNPIPDFLDCLRVTLQPPKTGGVGFYFVGSVQILKRHSALGKHYENLQAAVEYARLLLQNSTHLEDHDRIFRRALEFLEALEGTSLPQAALLKAVYRFLREEGHPVKEDWWQLLPAADRQTAAHLLNQPLREITANGEDSERLLASLKIWAERKTDLI